MKFKWTLYRKILILIVLVLLSVYISSNIAIVNVINNQVRRTFSDNTINTSILLQKNIESLFGDAEAVIKNVEIKLNNLPSHDEQIITYLDMVTSSMNSIINGYVAYNDGSFILSSEEELDGDIDPRNRIWYKQAFRVNGIKWSNPYVDVVTNQLVITGSTYIQQGNIEGVFGIDLNINRLNDIITSSSISQNGFILLVNAEGDIINDSLNKKVGEEIEVLEDEEFLNSQIITGTIETQKGVYHLRQLNRTNLRIISFLPKEDLVEAVSKVRSLSSFILFITLFLGFIITYFVSKKFTKPLEELILTIEKSTYGNTIQLHTGYTNDEIGKLIVVYNNLANSVNEQNRKINLVSNELISSDKKLHEQYIKITELAYTDHLTGLPNRIKFEQVAKQMIEDQIRFALFYLDLDNFKVINDTYGHRQGDYVLEVLSRRFEECCSERYIVSRLSGDEFGIIVPIKVAISEVRDKAKKILSIVNTPIKFDNLEFEITGSIGISIFPDDAESFDVIFSNADIAMFEAKSLSKNQYVIFNSKLKSDLIHKVNLESRLLQSIERNEMLVYYQPIMNYKTKSVDGFEALVRWKDSNMGMIFPDIFIPIAEHNLFINKIGDLVLEESIKLGIELKEQFGRYYVMNVNVSAVSLHLERFVDNVVALLKKYDYPAGYLNLEITESIALETDNSIIKKLSMLHKIGIQISLDDFGTGYSSINHLLNLSLTHLKIDRSLIVEAVKTDEVYRLIKGIVDFAHTIHLIVVAEGVEDAYMEQMMGHMGVDLCQGYLYSKAVSEKEIKMLLKQEKFSK